MAAESRACTLTQPADGCGTPFVSSLLLYTISRAWTSFRRLVGRRVRSRSPNSPFSVAFRDSDVLLRWYSFSNRFGNCIANRVILSKASFGCAHQRAFYLGFMIGWRSARSASAQFLWLQYAESPVSRRAAASSGF